MTEPDPTRIVADTDVLLADLFVGGNARAALDLIRAHSWLSLILTPALLTETEQSIISLADERLAANWRERSTEVFDIVEPVADGHPALVAAHASQAASVLSFDDQLGSASAGVALRPHLATSVKSPHAFVTMIDPASLYEAIYEEPYPGADRDPRA